MTGMRVNVRYGLAVLCAVVLVVWSGGRCVGQSRHTDSLAASGVHDSSGTGGTSTGESGPADYVIRPWHSARGHLHNKLIHLPIGFALAAFALSIVALRWSEVKPAVRWLVLFAALGAVLAVLTGLGQAPAYDGSSKEWVVALHRNLGIATAAGLWIWAALLWFRRSGFWVFAAGLVVVILLTAAGFFGGIVAHG